jgi:TetR/AcrR family transcriptional repressor of nem operon
MPAAQKTTTESTATRVLDIAERLVQTRGFNGFSYADVADELGVTKASLHYHFAAKADLGQAIVERYSTRFMHALEQIDASTRDDTAKLAAYAELYAEVMRGERMCLCGMLAAEFETLPAPIGETVVHFFDANVVWLAHVLEDGRAAGTLAYDGSAEDAARALLGALQGAMLLARPYGDIARFEATAAHTLGALAAPARA